ncbi:DUF4230 domain-containing protein [Niabella drilacis]|uniref:DUF4230 domain-containing protein n=1 Tax=Niabella drilacis (strain DSM 25811 / CCM 8410 / CCUG 62505 / LMG 26954 / E90) TaxID=1285928 RepID=A0A1G6IM95_NIADE|nr:DUF4230 domain-containing protein [Niabella drilacis]SDC07607.1 Protein of unknown function [Niabella drilacis]
MQKSCLPLVILVCVIAVGILAYLLGKRNGTKTIDHIALNAAFVQEVAELSSLEVQGTASIRTTNVANDGSITDELRKLFAEQTLNISVPYIAKYGVNLQQQQLTIEEKNRQVYIVIPAPQLLSYELRLDRADASTRKGLLTSFNEAAYSTVEKKLYTASRKQLDGQPVYVEQAKEKIRKVLEQYYAPMQFKVNVVFKDEIKSKVNSPLN